MLFTYDEFKEAEHPRAKGGEHGGQFVAKGEGGEGGGEAAGKNWKSAEFDLFEMTDAVASGELTDNVNLSKAERKLVDDYQGNFDSFALNAGLRQGKDLDEHQRSIVEGLDKLFARSELSQAMPVWRSLHYRDWGGAGIPRGAIEISDLTKEGGFTDQAYVSTSGKPIGSADMKIMLPKGAQALMMKDTFQGYDGENEVILPRGSQFEYLGKDDNGIATFSLKEKSGTSAATAALRKPPLDMDKMKRVGAQLGSNPGGVFEGSDGTRYYIKKGRSPAHVRSEYMAGGLYNLAGAPTLKYAPVDGNWIATQWEHADKTNARQFSPAELKTAQEDFAVHAWLANWDAAGLDFDNQMVINGVPTSVDLGGALDWRARGEPKGKAFGNSVGEWDTLRDKGMNPANAWMFASMKPEQLKQSAKKVASIPDASIREVVKAYGGDHAMVDKLIARKRDIAERAAVAVQDAEFKESEHPRAKGGGHGGQFVKKGGEGTGSTGAVGEAAPLDDVVEADAKQSKKRDTAKAMLLKGATAKELCDALGWKRITVPPLLRALGLKMEKIKEGGVTRYKGVPMTPEEKKGVTKELVEKKAVVIEKVKEEVKQPLPTGGKPNLITEPSVGLLAQSRVSKVMDALPKEHLHLLSGMPIKVKHELIPALLLGMSKNTCGFFSPPSLNNPKGFIILFEKAKHVSFVSSINVTATHEIGHALDASAGWTLGAHIADSLNEEAKALNGIEQHYAKYWFQNNRERFAELYALTFTPSISGGERYFGTLTIGRAKQVFAKSIEQMKKVTGDYIQQKYQQVKHAA